MSLMSDNVADRSVDDAGVLAVILTGPPGAGKTSVLTALAGALTDDDVPHAAVEVELLVLAHPVLDDDQWQRQVQAVCGGFCAAGHDLLLVAQTVESDHDMARLKHAVGADEAFVVRLEALPDTLGERIVAREPASWSGLPGLVAHSRELATSMPALLGVDLVLSTEGEHADAVAERIRAARPERLRPRRG
jgi:energy-coupling factor transporter ATP-binding protein EcfA2